MGTLAALALIRIAADFRPFLGAISMIDLAIWLGFPRASGVDSHSEPFANSSPCRRPWAMP
jgi:hypothetical protein